MPDCKVKRGGEWLRVCGGQVVLDILLPVLTCPLLGSSSPAQTWGRALSLSQPPGEAPLSHPPPRVVSLPLASAGSSSVRLRAFSLEACLPISRSAPDDCEAQDKGINGGSLQVPTLPAKQPSPDPVGASLKVFDSWEDRLWEEACKALRSRLRSICAGNSGVLET